MKNSGPWQLISAIAVVYGLVTAPFNIAPLLVGALITVLGASQQQAGNLLSLELLAMSVVAIGAAPLGGRLRRPLILYLSAFILFAAHVISGLVQEYGQLLSLRLLSGVAAGVLLLAVNTTIAATNDPVRFYGAAAVAATVIGLLLLFFMPGFIVEAGLVGAYGPLAVLALLALAVVRWLATPSTAGSRFSVSRQGSQPTSIISTNRALLLFALFAVQATQAALYAYSEQLGINRAGLAADEMGMLLVVGYLSAVPASALASWLSYRWGRRLPLLIGFCCYAAAAVAMAVASPPEIFATAFVLFNFSYFFVLPYQLGIPADLDHSGSLSGVGVGTIFIGLSCGAFLGGLMVSQAGYTTLCLVAAGTGCLAAGMLIHVVGSSLETGPAAAARVL